MKNRIFDNSNTPNGWESEPAAIFEKMRSCPPLMRTEAQNAYIGKEVAWLLYFADGSIRENGEAHLIFRITSDPVRIDMVTGRVLLADYPWLKSLKAGEAVHVRGRIRQVDSFKIEIGMLELEQPHSRIAPSVN